MFFLLRSLDSRFRGNDNGGNVRGYKFDMFKKRLMPLSLLRVICIYRALRAFGDCLFKSFNRFLRYLRNKAFFIRRELLEHYLFCRNISLAGNTYAEAPKFVCLECADNGLNAFVSGGALAERKFCLAERNIRVVVDDDYGGGLYFIEAGERAGRGTRFIHKRIRKRYNDLFFVDLALAHFGVPFFFKPKIRQIGFFPKCGGYFAADIVARIIVFFPGIAEADNEKHRMIHES